MLPTVGISERAVSENRSNKSASSHTFQRATESMFPFIYNPAAWNFSTFTELLQAHEAFLKESRRSSLEPPYFWLDARVDKWLKGDEFKDCRHRTLLYLREQAGRDTSSFATFAWYADYLLLHDFAILPFYAQAYEESDVLRSLPMLSFIVADGDLAKFIKASLIKSKKTYFNCYRVHPYRTIHVSGPSKRATLLRSHSKSPHSKTWTNVLEVSPGLDENLGFFNLDLMRDLSPYVFEVMAFEWKPINIAERVRNYGEHFWISQKRRYKFMKPPEKSTPLLSLPHELILEIRSYLPLCAQSSLQRSCKAMDAIIGKDVRREPFRRLQFGCTESGLQDANSMLENPLITHLRHFTIRVDMRSETDMSDIILSLRDTSTTVKFQLEGWPLIMDRTITRLLDAQNAGNLKFEVETFQESLHNTALNAGLLAGLSFDFILQLGRRIQATAEGGEIGQNLRFGLFRWSRWSKSIEVAENAPYGTMSWTYNDVVRVIREFVYHKEHDWDGYTPLESITITGYECPDMDVSRRDWWWHLVKHRKSGYKSKQELKPYFKKVRYAM